MQLEYNGDIQARLHRREDEQRACCYHVHRSKSRKQLPHVALWHIGQLLGLPQRCSSAHMAAYCTVMFRKSFHVTTVLSCIVLCSKGTVIFYCNTTVLYLLQRQFYFDTLGVESQKTRFEVDDGIKSTSDLRCSCCALLPSI